MSEFSLNCDGFALIDRILSPEWAHALIEAVGSIRHGPARREREGRIYALRNLLALPAVRNLSESPAIRALVEPVLGPDARIVRGLLFDKMPSANWKVAWHQDRSICVTERIEVPGYGPWSNKAGVVHVQPPVAVLENMLTLRLSLDTCGLDNGPLRVLPGSHAHGILSEQQIAVLRAQRHPVACTLEAGGALLMRPLLLHSSSAAITPGHRRVIHLEFAAGDLAGGLRWCDEQQVLKGDL
jgi:ectoine hydroxylase-related dioxygenase (phytanoyl-CoA dioxygenase family)